MRSPRRDRRPRGLSPRRAWRSTTLSARRRAVALGLAGGVVVALVAGVIAASGGSDGEEQPAPSVPTTPEVTGDGVLTIGALIPSTGDLEFVGEGMVEAAAMAVRDINAAGGVLGRDVEIVVEDTASRADLARATVDEWLAAGDVDVVLGPMSSRAARGVVGHVAEAGVAGCSPTATGLDVAGFGETGYFVTTAPTDELQASVIADLVAGDDADAADDADAGDDAVSVAVLHVADPYGEPFAAAAVRRLEARGVEVGDVVALDPLATGYEAEARRLADAEPDALVVIAFPDTAAAVVRALLDAGIDPGGTPVYLTDSSQTSGLGALVDPDDPSVVAGIRGTAPSAAPATGAAWFAPALEEAAPGVRPVFAAHLYDCIALAALAAEAAGSDEPEEFAPEVVEVSRGGEVCETVSACFDLLASGNEIDYRGASGALDLDDAGTVTTGEYEVWSLTGQVEGDRVLIAIDATRFVGAGGTVGPAPDPGGG